jgi:hypothetical protein
MTTVPIATDLLGRVASRWVGGFPVRRSWGVRRTMTRLCRCHGGSVASVIEWQDPRWQMQSAPHWSHQGTCRIDLERRTMSKHRHLRARILRLTPASATSRPICIFPCFFVVSIAASDGAGSDRCRVAAQSASPCGLALTRVSPAPQSPLSPPQHHLVVLLLQPATHVHCY